MSQLYIVLAMEDQYLIKNMVLHAVLYSTHCVWFSLTAQYMQLCGSCHKFVTPLMSKVKNLETIRDI